MTGTLIKGSEYGTVNTQSTMVEEKIFPAVFSGVVETPFTRLITFFVGVTKNLE